VRALYTLVLYLLAPLVLLRLCARAAGNRDYLSGWGERFALGCPERARQGVIWVHAVSVGEVQAAVPLVQALREKYPQRPVLITTMTPTGTQTVLGRLGRDTLHAYAAYDLPGAVNRFLDCWQPAITVIMETELWPNTIHACHARGIPLVLANARLSARSAARYGRFAGFARAMLGKFTAIAAQTGADAERLQALGAERPATHVTGNLKFDVNLPASLAEQAQVLRRAWGSERPVWIAASTHEGEDEQVLDAFDAIRATRPNTLLILVPRHPERFDAVAALVQARGYGAMARRSQAPLCGPETAVYVGDTMGDLLQLYAAADVAFVGGSLVPTGGHNMLEPAGLGVPVVSGPHVFNFMAVSQLLREAGAAWQVADAAELAQVTGALLDDANRRFRAGENGRQAVAANRGATGAMLEIIDDCLGGSA